MRRSLFVVFALFVACSSPPVAPQLPSVGAWQYIPEGSGEPDVQGPEWAWTGSRLFVLGATNALKSESDATLLDPDTAVWTPSTAVSGLSPRQYGFSVWTGAEVFVWSGLTYRTDLADGGLYDPATDSWRPLPAAPISPRHLGTAVWTGAAVIVWGGMSLDSASNDVYFNDGARFDPASGTWSSMALSGAPSPRSWSSAVWTGTRMLVWGGQDANGQLGDGAAYDPIADAWTPISAVGAPSPREAHGSVWSGTEMIVVAGECVGYFCRDGGRYDPAKDSWTLFSIPAPSGYICGELDRLDREQPPDLRRVAIGGRVGRHLRPAGEHLGRDGARPEPARRAGARCRSLDGQQRDHLRRAVERRVLRGWGALHAMKATGLNLPMKFLIALAILPAAACLTCSGGNGGASGALTGAWCGLQVTTAADCVGNNDAVYAEFAQTGTTVTGQSCEYYLARLSSLTSIENVVPSPVGQRPDLLDYTFSPDSVHASLTLSADGQTLSGTYASTKCSCDVPVTLHRLP